MSSSLIVEVCTVNRVEDHPNADRMCICTVKGWKVCAKKIDGKNEYEEGQKCVYFPPDTIIPNAVAEKFDLGRYLQYLPKNPDGSVQAEKRVRVANLRSEKSYGLIIPCENPEWSIGYSVVEHYGLKKWEPPLQATDGDAEKENIKFFKYTGIEHLQNFPGVIADGEEVVFTEKLHGKNVRLGYIREADEKGEEKFVFMVGSHSVRRKEFSKIKKAVRDEFGDFVKDENGDFVHKEVITPSEFWQCLTPEVKNLLVTVSQNKEEVIIYGEMIGAGVQDMTYNCKRDFRAFDIMINGYFIDHDVKRELFAEHGVPCVPIIYQGPFSQAKVEEYVDGPTTMCPEGTIKNQFSGREGIVITPVKERNDRNGKPGSGRVVFKCVSFDYLNRKGGTEDH